MDTITQEIIAKNGKKKTETHFEEKLDSSQGRNYH